VLTLPDPDGVFAAHIYAKFPVMVSLAELAFEADADKEAYGQRIKVTGLDTTILSFAADDAHPMTWCYIQKPIGSCDRRYPCASPVSPSSGCAGPGSHSVGVPCKQARWEAWERSTDPQDEIPPLSSFSKTAGGASTTPAPEHHIAGPVPAVAFVYKSRTMLIEEACQVRA
jgi:hypothetical protein